MLSPPYSFSIKCWIMCRKAIHFSFNSCTMFFHRMATNILENGSTTWWVPFYHFIFTYGLIFYTLALKTIFWNHCVLSLVRKCWRYENSFLDFSRNMERVIWSCQTDTPTGLYHIYFYKRRKFFKVRAWFVNLSSAFSIILFLFDLTHCWLKESFFFWI